MMVCTVTNLTESASATVMQAIPSYMAIVSSHALKMVEFNVAQRTPGEVADGNR